MREEGEVVCAHERAICRAEEGTDALRLTCEQCGADCGTLTGHGGHVRDGDVVRLPQPYSLGSLGQLSTPDLSPVDDSTT